MALSAAIDRAFLMLQRITFEENAERLKVVIPLKRMWGFWLTYSLLLLVWMGASAWALVYLFNLVRGGNFGFQGVYLLAWIVIMLIIAAAWWWVGSRVWRYWQYYSANREILFFYKDGRLVVRRPLSLLGVTDAYDWKHVTPFKFDDKVNAPTFGYGSHRVPVGLTLTTAESAALVEYLNQRYFPLFDADDA